MLLQISLILVFLSSLTAQLYLLLGRQRRLAQYRPADADGPGPQNPVSVIISARNEVRNLSDYLPAILDQDYPDYEVIVVNDCSSDGSDILLHEMQARYQRLRVVTVTENYRHKTGKKFALTMGIKAAANECLLFTDADCRPASNQWLKLMTRNIEGATQLVLGYSPYMRSANLLNAFIRFETLKTGINYLSAALSGDAYMGIGRNLAYTKTLFFSAKGFASHMHLLSGDDDLFVNQNATTENVKIEMGQNAFTFSPAKAGLSAWYRQKTRHTGVGKHYKNRHRRLLTIDALSGFIFYVLLIIAITCHIQPLPAVGFFLIRLILQLIIYTRLFKKLGAADLVFYLPFLDLLYYLYLNVFGLIGSFVKTTQWK